jgi:hypothetical protein
VTAATDHDVLFLDELSAFDQQVLEVRQPSWTPAGGSELKCQLDVAVFVVDPGAHPVRIDRRQKAREAMGHGLFLRNR